MSNEKNIPSIEARERDTIEMPFYFTSNGVTTFEDLTSYEAKVYINDLVFDCIQDPTSTSTKILRIPSSENLFKIGKYTLYFVLTKASDDFRLTILGEMTILKGKV